MAEKSYIAFVDVTTMAAKTQKWAVMSKSSQNQLGMVEWYGAWRQYVFMPSPSSLWSSGCLEDVRAFLVKVNAERRGACLT